MHSRFLKKSLSAFLISALLISGIDINALAQSVDTEIEADVNAQEEEPTEEQPSTDIPAGDEPTEEEPAEEHSSTDAPAEEEPAAEKPTEEQPSTDIPAGDEPTEEEPAEEQPSTDIPAGDEQKEEEPTEEQPSTEEPAADESAEEEEGILSASMTQTFLIDTEEPYDGNYLLVANVSVNEKGEAEAVGSLPSSNEALYNVEDTGHFMFSTDDASVYGFDENGRGLIDPASFLPEPVIDEDDFQYRANMTAVSVTEYSVGDERTFNVDITSGDELVGVKFVCVAVGGYCTVWVPCEDPIYAADAGKMKAYMGEFAAEFDSRFPDMTDMFGSKDIVDSKYGDNDGKTALLCYDIDGNGVGSGSYVAGYFFGADLNINYTNRTGNNIDCLHIDSWQGMNRNVVSGTLVPTYSKRTMVHELQHMINFSICRENENTFNRITIPDYLNEAYSEAAAHLCYGADTSRIAYYNGYSYISGGRVSLMQWRKVDTLSNYALSYIFGQYIRTQYENGDTIYKDTMSSLSESDNLLNVIADKLGVTKEELLFNFRAAMFLKNAEGVYGFAKEEWAESIKPKSTTAGSGMTLVPGAAFVVPVNDSFMPSGAGNSIRFAGMYSDKTKDNIEVKILGAASITEKEGRLSLTAEVLPKGVSQSVIFSMPNESDRAYAQVNTAGVVRAVADGTVTVRAASVYNPSKYADVSIEITGQDEGGTVNIAMEQIRTDVLGGVRVEYASPKTPNAEFYYTVNGGKPGMDSEPLPKEGILFNEAGTYSLKVLAHDPEDLYEDGYDEDEIVVEQLAAPEINAEDEDTGALIAQKVDITAPDGADVYYTTDASKPSASNGVRYDAPFILDTAGTVIVRAVSVKAGMADSVDVERSVVVRYHDESGRKPYITNTSLTLNKKTLAGTNVSILPIMDNTIVDAVFVDNTDNFILERQGGTNNWNVGLVNKSLANKTYNAKVRVSSLGTDGKKYVDILDVKIKVIDTKPAVSLKSVTINTLFPTASYPLILSSKSGKAAALGLKDGSIAGFTENFEIKDGVLYLKKPYSEFTKTAANKPVLSGRLDVQVEGYEPQELSINVKTTGKMPALSASVSPLVLNFTELNAAKSFTFSLDRKINSKERERVENISGVVLNEKGGSNYKKAAAIVDSFTYLDGENITVSLKDVKSGTYTLPLLISAGREENTFVNVKCNVKFTINKENVKPVIKLSSSKVKLNRKMTGGKAYITIKSVSQYNAKLKDIQCEHVLLTGQVNNKSVSLSYNAQTKMLEAQIKAGTEPECGSYKFNCKPVYDGGIIEGGPFSVTVSIVDKTPVVSVKAKGSIDVLNRDTSSVVYTVKKSNFDEKIISVEYEKASVLTQTIQDGTALFNAPELMSGSTVGISVKSDAVFTKGRKYAFRLKFKLEGSETSVITKDIFIKPRQSKVKLTSTAKPVFYTYVNSGNNRQSVEIGSKNGTIDKIEYAAADNKKIPDSIMPVFEDGVLKAVTFNGNETIRKGTYKLTFKVYYKGQMLEAPVAGKDSYAKPAVFRLTVKVK